MRHYEIVIMFNLNKNENILDLIKYYSNYIKENKGKIYKIENWGKRKLAYKIKKHNRAFYILLNIRISKDNLNKISETLKFDKSVIRNLIIRIKRSTFIDSPIMKSIKDNEKLIKKPLNNNIYKRNNYV